MKNKKYSYVGARFIKSKKKSEKNEDIVKPKESKSKTLKEKQSQKPPLKDFFGHDKKC